MRNYFKKTSILLLFSVFPYISADCIQFWKEWRTCPRDIFPGLLCFYQGNNTDQALITKTPPKQTGIVCHSDNFPLALFNCLPIKNTTLFLFTNCPFPQIPFSHFIPDETLLEISIKFSKVKVQSRSLIIENYPQLKTLFLEGIFHEETFRFHLRNLPSLQLFVVHVCNFTRMSNRPFKDAPQLQEVIITVGQLETLPGDFFYGAVNLAYLDLSQNRLNTFKSALLKETANLLQLNLSSNHLAELDHDTFHQTKNLQNLLLDNNRIEVLPPDVFRTLITLKTLLLHSNNITELQEEIFHNLSSLQVLSLGHNSIRALPKNIFINLVSLMELNLQNNKLATLPQNLFVSQTVLHQLDLSGNMITNLTSPTPFGTSKHLFKVDMSRNQLEEIPNIEWSSHNISNMDFSYNKIHSFTFSLELLDGCLLNLQFNQIEMIPTEVYLLPGPVLSYNILLKGNPFNCSCSLLNFVKSLPVLPILDKDSLQCHNPWFLKHKSLISVNSENLCSNYRTTCPVDCNCEKSDNGDVHVDCSNLEKTHAPSYLPPETTVLNIDNNFILNITDLKLGPNLSELSVSNNSLISLNGFEVPPGLKFLKLDGNDLSDLPQNVRDHVKATEDFKIYLADNFWICNCHSKPLKQWFMENLPKIQDSMHVNCIRDLKSGKRSLLVETRIDEFICSSSLKKCEPVLIFVVFVTLLILFK